ncbi:hypothetical protein CASFOL_036567 [Castilleja foliolosa]|uniref:Uncharacterized protein n=1 Tax=Castilleja foliolosa TaxID=1961234 RepID=A0ABD3BYC4_9LAMI
MEVRLFSIFPQLCKPYVTSADLEEATWLRRGSGRLRLCGGSGGGDLASSRIGAAEVRSRTPRQFLHRIFGFEQVDSPKFDFGVIWLKLGSSLYLYLIERDPNSKLPEGPWSSPSSSMADPKNLPRGHHLCLCVPNFDSFVHTLKEKVINIHEKTQPDGKTKQALTAGRREQCQSDGGAKGRQQQGCHDGGLAAQGRFSGGVEPRWFMAVCEWRRDTIATEDFKSLEAQIKHLIWLEKLGLPDHCKEEDEDQIFNSDKNW